MKLSDEARPAATVIIARRASSGLPQFLMQERAEGMSFAGGAMVFPGGAVDESDISHAHELLDGGGDIAEMAARIAAVRETIEECGLLLAAGSHGTDGVTAALLRHALKSGKALAEVANDHGIEFDFAQLVPFARWCPSPRMSAKRFDTRFYLAMLEEGMGADQLRPDGNESVRLAWHSAREVLEEADAGRARIIFPTRRTLERLALSDSIEALIEHAYQYPVEIVTPRIETRDGVDHLCIPEGLGYPITSEPLSTAKRA